VWQIDLAGAATDGITTDWILDASGRDAVMGRILELPRDELKYPKRIALYNHFSGIPRRTDRRGGNTHIVRLPGGWFWVIPLAGDKTSVGLVMPLDEAGGGQLRDPEGVFWRTVRETKLLPEMMENAKPLDKYRVTADYCFCHSRFADEGVFMIGDAATRYFPPESAWRARRRIARWKRCCASSARDGLSTDVSRSASRII
jgi:flavin-dependent dehydrogenase